VPTNIVLVGPPGVGKGTQASLLNQRRGLVHLASGDIFRQEISSGSDLGRLAKEFIDQGKLVPDDVTIGMMEARFTTEHVKSAGFVLDGFPRTVAQGEALDCKLAELGLSLSAVLSLEVPDEDLVQRLGGRRVCEHCGEVFHVIYRPPKIQAFCDVCGNDLVVRSDDKEETIRKRLEVFHLRTEPVLAYYEQSGRLQRVPASGSIEDVYGAIVQRLPA
jgi:adenylate kinase